MTVNIVSRWEPKSNPPPKIRKENKLFLYQDRVANRHRNFKLSEIFKPRLKTVY